MSTVTIHKVSCPHPDCGGNLHIREDLPAGEYQCICKACRVQVSWATYLQGGNKPFVSLVEKKVDGQ